MKTTILVDKELAHQIEGSKSKFAQLAIEDRLAKFLPNPKQRVIRLKERISVIEMECSLLEAKHKSAMDLLKLEKKELKKDIKSL